MAIHTVLLITTSSSFVAEKIDYQALAYANKASRLGNYAISKLANCLFTIGLRRRNHKAFTVHPGAVATDLYRYNPLAHFGVRNLGRIFMKSPQEGAMTTLRVALMEEQEVFPHYYADMISWPPSAFALDELEADVLWRFSEKALGL